MIHAFCKVLNPLCIVCRYQTGKMIILRYTIQVNITSNRNVAGQMTMLTFLAISYKVKSKSSTTYWIATTYMHKIWFLFLCQIYYSFQHVTSCVRIAVFPSHCPVAIKTKWEYRMTFKWTHNWLGVHSYTQMEDKDDLNNLTY